jgi:hypothetical protein
VKHHGHKITVCLVTSSFFRCHSRLCLHDEGRQAGGSSVPTKVSTKTVARIITLFCTNNQKNGVGVMELKLRAIAMDVFLVELLFYSSLLSVVNGK